MNLGSRLLGMAFASADLLFELKDGRIAFAVGAGPVAGIDPASAWSGRPLSEVLDVQSACELTDNLAALGSGRRSAPMEIRVVTGDGRARRASLRAFVLPEIAPAISCALSWTGPAFVLAVTTEPPILDARGLISRLEDVMTSPGADNGLSVAFVEVPGLDTDSDEHRAASARIESELQAASLNGASACRLSADRFALMRGADDLTDLVRTVEAAAAAEGLSLSATTATGDLNGAESAVAVRTLRLALDACLKDGVAAGASFGERLKETVADADRFRGIVRAREFHLVYQPIVSLESGAMHHFEALARFNDGPRAPVAQIAMAEELGLIEGFDLAVAEKALVQMRKAGFGRAKIAINASALSLTGDAYVENLLRMTAAATDVRDRLLVEITETAAVADLEAANRRLAVLRDAGFKVCIDDFGAGSASFDYLRSLQVDMVKLDGVFVHEIATEQRARTLATHVIQLCADLGVATVAEMVETQAQADALKALGVNYGQGWLFGRPGPTPTSQTQSRPVARRRGEVVGWG
ncbi:EAL domain-containing protein [Brevundimonas kwangchunensis]|uniref:EAL domain-containing protein n=1 Tax=Brevundimonas kwangchunensis TaxID=322163 RepID=A0ABN1GYQ1_9CAUL